MFQHVLYEIKRWLLSLFLLTLNLRLLYLVLYSIIYCHVKLSSSGKQQIIKFSKILSYYALLHIVFFLSLIEHIYLLNFKFTNHIGFAGLRIEGLHLLLSFWGNCLLWSAFITFQWFGLVHIHIQQQVYTRAMQPGLIMKCFIRKSISHHLCIFSPVDSKALCSADS